MIVLYNCTPRKVFERLAKVDVCIERWWKSAIRGLRFDTLGRRGIHLTKILMALGNTICITAAVSNTPSNTHPVRV